MRNNERGRRWTFFSSPVIIEQETTNETGNSASFVGTSPNVQNERISNESPPLEQHRIIRFELTPTQSHHLHIRIRKTGRTTPAMCSTTPCVPQSQGLFALLRS